MSPTFRPTRLPNISQLDAGLTSHFAQPDAIRPVLGLPGPAAKVRRHSLPYSDPLFKSSAQVLSAPFGTPLPSARYDPYRLKNPYLTAHRGPDRRFAILQHYPLALARMHA
ncbi:hypothetical protein RhiXN_07406 [Rhizoctonia solani]|uniref:Uncharacterized protein n=1 Tax=Rhizoctonia solani TaxID=456999 RepID=A0A8H8P8H4_9AGAM|nr:uncharacterized protein RhiXN_07406 [Rhizoctonia solani]QRW25457.1 hypothetical protein RhiXN_07406 [Rhizoctonia solani]